MELPPNFNNLPDKVQDILKRHIKEDVVVNGETGHITESSVEPEVQVAVAHPNPPKITKKFNTFIENSLPPGDRE